MLLDFSDHTRTGIFKSMNCCALASKQGSQFYRFVDMQFIDLYCVKEIAISFACMHVCMHDNDIQAGYNLIQSKKKQQQEWFMFPLQTYAWSVNKPQCFWLYLVDGRTISELIFSDAIHMKIFFIPVSCLCNKKVAQSNNAATPTEILLVEKNRGKIITGFFAILRRKLLYISGIAQYWILTVAAASACAAYSANTGRGIGPFCWYGNVDHT